MPFFFYYDGYLRNARIFNIDRGISEGAALSNDIWLIEQPSECDMHAVEACMILLACVNSMIYSELCCKTK